MLLPCAVRLYTVSKRCSKSRLTSPIEGSSEKTGLDQWFEPKIIKVCIQRSKFGSAAKRRIALSAMQNLYS